MTETMPARTDRRMGERFFIKWFPEGKGKSSSEWNAFLNEKAGLSISESDRNTAAFDAWRQALADKGYEGIWR